MRAVVTTLVAALATSASAQTSAAAPPRYGLAPWWMDKPIIASTGYVWTEVQANRAMTSATYDAVERESAAAQRAAVEKVRALGEALSAYGADKVRVETTFRIQPLYDQYRDRQGEVNENQRADKIERYQVVAHVNVEIRDVRLAERVYATLMAAKPTSTQGMRFRLEAENETRTQMSKLAVADARRRALLATEAAGTQLGGVRLIDPTGRACMVDVLVAGAAQGYDDITVTAQRVAAPPPPPPPIPPLPVPPVERRGSAGGLDPTAVQLPLQPPMLRLEERACVVYGLG
jgi:uncharacterized protein YggE